MSQSRFAKQLELSHNIRLIEKDEVIIEFLNELAKVLQYPSLQRLICKIFLSNKWKLSDESIDHLLQITKKATKYSHEISNYPGPIDKPVTSGLKYLATLPRAVFNHIGHHLSVKSCINLSLSCHKLHSMVHNQSFYDQLGSQTFILVLKPDLLNNIFKNNCIFPFYHKSKHLYLETSLLVDCDTSYLGFDFHNLNSNAKNAHHCVFRKLIDAVDNGNINISRDKSTLKSTSNCKSKSSINSNYNNDKFCITNGNGNKNVDRCGTKDSCSDPDAVNFDLQWFKQLFGNIKRIFISNEWGCAFEHLPMNWLFNKQNDNSPDIDIIGAVARDGSPTRLGNEALEKLSRRYHEYYETKKLFCRVNISGENEVDINSSIRPIHRLWYNNSQVDSHRILSRFHKNYHAVLVDLLENQYKFQNIHQFLQVIHSKVTWLEMNILNTKQAGLSFNTSHIHSGINMIISRLFNTNCNSNSIYTSTNYSYAHKYLQLKNPLLCNDQLQLVAMNDSMNISNNTSTGSAGGGGEDKRKNVVGLKEDFSKNEASLPFEQFLLKYGCGMDDLPRVTTLSLTFNDSGGSNGIRHLFNHDKLFKLFNFTNSVKYVNLLCTNRDEMGLVKAPAFAVMEKFKGLQSVQLVICVENETTVDAIKKFCVGSLVDILVACLARDVIMDSSLNNLNEITVEWGNNGPVNDGFIIETDIIVGDKDELLYKNRDGLREKICNHVEKLYSERLKPIWNDKKDVIVKRSYQFMTEFHFKRCYNV